MHDNWIWQKEVIGDFAHSIFRRDVELEANVLVVERLDLKSWGEIMLSKEAEHISKYTASIYFDKIQNK